MSIRIRILTRQTWAIAALTACVGAAQAELIDRGGGLVYDTERNLTWLADMNHARTSGYDADGLMTWAQASAWASQLVYGGVDDWRLPTLNAADTTCSLSFNPGGGLPVQYYGYNCRRSELAGLFVAQLGTKANQSVLNAAGDTPRQVANLALFSNVQSGIYWSGTEYVGSPDYAWFFRADVGLQTVDDRDYEFFAVAVREGDVPPVPEPATYALFGLGLAAVGAAARRRRCAGPGPSRRV